MKQGKTSDIYTDISYPRIKKNKLRGQDQNRRLRACYFCLFDRFLPRTSIHTFCLQCFKCNYRGFWTSPLAFHNRCSIFKCYFEIELAIHQRRKAEQQIYRLMVQEPFLTQGFSNTLIWFWSSSYMAEPIYSDCSPCSLHRAKSLSVYQSATIRHWAGNFIQNLPILFNAFVEQKHFEVNLRYCSANYSTDKCPLSAYLSFYLYSDTFGER